MSIIPAVGEPNTTREQDAARRGPIVVASDGSDASAGALAVARELAYHLQAGLELVSVMEPTNVLVPSLQPTPPPLHRGATRVRDRRERLRKLCERSPAGRPQCATRILVGDPPSSIARAAQSHGARLVVTGRVPHGRIERVVRRETPLATARAGRVPVLSVPADAARLPRRIVVAVGRGEAAARLTPIAEALFHEALVVHLVAVTPRAAAPWESDAREQDDAVRHEAQRGLARARAALRLPADVPIETRVVAGEPGVALASFVESAGADLLVVGQTRRDRTPHLPLADLATRLFRSVTCATLIVPVERHLSSLTAVGTSISTARDEWPPLLERFNRRNCGRTASLTIDEHGGPPRGVVTAWVLTGVDCDPAGNAVAIMLADPADAARHVTHLVAQPTVIAISDTQPECDDLLVIGYDAGQIALCLS